MTDFWEADPVAQAPQGREKPFWDNDPVTQQADAFWQKDSVVKTEGEPPGRLRSAAGSAAQALTDTLVASPLKTTSIMRREAQQTWAERDKYIQAREAARQKYIDEGLTPLEAGKRAEADANRPEVYQLSPEEEAAIPTAESGLGYKLAEGIDKKVGEILPTNPAYAGDFFTSTLPSGIGSIVGLIGAGAVGGLGASAALGSLAAAIPEYELATKNGASPNDAMKTFLLNAGLGLTDVVPIAEAFGHVDKATGGWLKNAFIRAIKSGSEEAIQEVFQTAAQNLIASKVIAYDPERDLFTGAGEQGAAGGVIGAAMGILLGKRAVPDHKLPANIESLILERKGGSEAPVIPPQKPGVLPTPATIPEIPETLNLQLEKVKNGEKPAVLYTEGTELPKEIPAGLRKVKIPEGTVLFDPKTVTHGKVVEAAKAGRLNDVLDLGDLSKADIIPRVLAGEKPKTVVERSPQGTEVAAAVGTEATVGAQKASLEAKASQGNRVGIEDPVQTLSARQNFEPKEVYRGYGRSNKASVYAGAPVAIAGKGSYYALDKAYAQKFGPKIATRTTENLRPLRITSGQQWQELTKEAGWAFPNPYNVDGEKLSTMTESLKALVQSKGFDSLEVSWDNEIPGDVGPNGENLKLLRNVFDEPQIVVYNEGPKAAISLRPDIENAGEALLSRMQAWDSGWLLQEYPDYDITSAKAVSVYGAEKLGASFEEWTKLALRVRNKFFPDYKIILDFESPLFNDERYTTSSGLFAGFNNGVLQIAINPIAFEPKRLAGTLTHELAHGIVYANLHKASAEEQQALYAAWLKRRAEIEGKPFLSVGSTIFGPDVLENWRLARERGRLENFERNAERTLADWYDFDEFMAEEISKHLLGARQDITFVGSFFAKVAEQIKQLFKLFGIDLNKASEPTVAAWVDSLLERQRAGYPSQTPVAIAEPQMKSQIANAKILGEPFNSIASPPTLAENMYAKRLFNFSGLGKKPGARLDKYNWWTRLTWNLWQIASENRHIQGLQNYVALNRAMDRSRMEMVSRADSRLKEWRKLGKDMGQNLSAFIWDIDNGSYLLPGENARWPTAQELVGLVRTHKLNQEAIQAYFNIRDDFLHVLDRVEQAWSRDAQRSISDPQQLAQALNEIQSEMQRLRSRPYFPHERFGRWTLTIKDGKTTESFQAFQTKAELKAASRVAKGKYGNSKTIIEDILPEEIETYQGLPPGVLKTIRSKLTLNATQAAAFDQLIFSMSPANSFAKKFTRRKDVEGFSLNAQRAYASYFQRAGGHISRLEYRQDMLDAIKEVQDSAGSLRGLVDAETMAKRRGLVDYMREHMKYMMDAGAEWQAVKSAAFFYYLGFAVDSAAINLTQVPLVAYPYMAARYGDLRTINELKNSARFFGRDRTKMGGKLPQDEVDAMNLGVEHGFLRESQAAELAGVADGGTLSRMIPGNLLNRTLSQIGNLASTPFKIMENINRDTVFHSAYRLAKQAPQKAHLRELELANTEFFNSLLAKGWSPENARAFLAGRDAVERTQFEYAKWARPKFLRGKLGSLFAFWNFKQNALWFLAHDPGKLRALGLLVATAGVMGLPGMEDLNDIFKVFASWALGKYVNPELEVRKVIRAMQGEDGESGIADLLLHGFGRDSFGMGWLAQQAGIPFPSVDLSYRLGFGKLVPGVGPMTDFRLDTSDKVVGTLQEAVGAAYSIPLTMMLRLADGSPDSAKQLERIMPRAARNVLRAMRYYKRGEETTGSGAGIADFDVTDADSLAEIVAVGLGFTPSRLSRKWDYNAQQQEIVKYWATRRGILFRQFAFAKQAKDKEGLDDAINAIRRFNANIPDRKLRITTQALRDSLKSRLSNQLKIEAGRSAIDQQLKPLFPEAFPQPTDVPPGQ